MKKLFNFLLVTMMLLSFSLTSNSQTHTFGCRDQVDVGEDFNLGDFTTEEGQTSVEEQNCGVKLELWNSLTIPYEPPYQNKDGEETDNVILELSDGADYDDFKVFLFNDGDEVGEFDFTVTNDDIAVIQVGNYVKNPKIVFKDNNTLGTIFVVKNVIFEGTNVANITNETLDETFNVYNYNNTLTIETSEFEVYNLQVYSLSGRLVFSENARGNFKTNLSENGFYIVKLEFENEILTKKVIVQ
ncbi:MAG: T9SS type A sorting domain-containing protein [Brumimicrobium sp.]